MKMKRNILVLLVIVLCVGMQARNTEQADTIHRLMSYNIHHARGMDGVVDTKRIGELIIQVDPEVVALQEVDSVSARSGGIDTMGDLSVQTGMYASYSASIPLQGGKYGIGLLTKEKPLNSFRIDLPGKEEARSALIVELEKYVIVCTHLSLDDKEQVASVDLINKAISKYSKPLFLIGDLNAVPESETMKQFGEQWKILNTTSEHTFPSENPNVTIDYVLAYKFGGDNLEKIRSEVIDERVASDHRPLLVEVKLKTK